MIREKNCQLDNRLGLVKPKASRTHVLKAGLHNSTAITSDSGNKTHRVAVPHHILRASSDLGN